MTDPPPAVPATPASASPPDVTRAVGPAPRRASRRRRGLAGVALFLACLTILLSTIAVWTHQVALDTDRFTGLVTDVAADPALIAPISSRVSTQVVEALDIQARISASLPGPAQVLAPAMTNAVRDAIDKRLQVALGDPRVQKALLTTVSFTHQRVVNLLRDKGDAATVVDGYIYLNVFPIVGVALTELQTMGLIPASVTLPDLSSPDAPDVLAGRLESALGITLPPTFGQIKLVPADKLLAARTVVRVFDLVVIALLVLSVVLVALALWLATSRRKMVLALAIGTIIVFLIARLALNGVRDFLIQGVKDGDLAGALRAVAGATFADLRSVTVFVLIATVILAIVAYAAGRPAWLTRTASATAGAASSSALGVRSVAASAGDKAPSSDALVASARANRAQVERIGLMAIGVVVLWLAAGPEVALLALVLVVGWEVIVGMLGRDSSDETAGPSASGGPSPAA